MLKVSPWITRRVKGQRGVEVQTQRKTDLKELEDGQEGILKRTENYDNIPKSINTFHEIQDK